MLCHLQISSYRIELMSVNGPISPKQFYYVIPHLLLWNGLLVLFVLLAGFPWNMARPQLHLLSLTVKKLRCQASYFTLRSPKPPIWDAPGVLTFSQLIFKMSLYYKTHLILETRRYHESYCYWKWLCWANFCSFHGTFKFLWLIGSEDQRYGSNFLRILAISLKFGRVMHSTMKQITGPTFARSTENFPW